MQNLITVNQNEIINTIKLLIYKENSSLLEKIDYDNDEVFLEPLLFSYFNTKSEIKWEDDLLCEIIQSFFIEKKSYKINYSYNKNDIAYIPNVGYFKKGSTEIFESILKSDEIEILKELHPTQELYFREFYRGHVINENPIHNSVWNENHKELEKAILIIKKHLPGFYQELIFANKKIYLHDNSKILNFTTIETLGVLYFYVQGQNNLIYFIEELIHQGSHNFFYYILHKKKDYFKIDVEKLIMRELTKEEWDYRDVYGAFHGLYTVTKRVECFDILVSNNVFNYREKHELLGRFTDQFFRFRNGLQLLNLDEVFTEKGKNLYQEYDNKCMNILNKYRILPSVFDLSNRDLDFRYEDFCILNPIEDFNKKERQGYFNF